LAERHPAWVLAASVTSGIAPLEPQEVDTLVGLNVAGVQAAWSNDRDAMTTLLAPVRASILADPVAGMKPFTVSANDDAILADPAFAASVDRGMREALRPGLDGWVDDSMATFGRWLEVHPETIAASIVWYAGSADRNVSSDAARRLVARLPAGRF